MTTRELYEQLKYVIEVENRGDDQIVIRRASGVLEWPSVVDHKGAFVRIICR